MVLPEFTAGTTKYCDFRGTVKSINWRTSDCLRQPAREARAMSEMRDERAERIKRLAPRRREFSVMMQKMLDLAMSINQQAYLFEHLEPHAVPNTSQVSSAVWSQLCKADLRTVYAMGESLPCSSIAPDQEGEGVEAVWSAMSNAELEHLEDVNNWMHDSLQRTLSELERTNVQMKFGFSYEKAALWQRIVCTPSPLPPDLAWQAVLRWAALHEQSAELEARTGAAVTAGELAFGAEAGAPDPESKKAAEAAEAGASPVTTKKRKLDLAPFAGFKAAGYAPPLAQSNGEGAAGGCEGAVTKS